MKERRFIEGSFPVKEVLSMVWDYGAIESLKGKFAEKL